MQRPASAQQITDRWAGKALDFDPGTKWQYSNTNYVIAGAIVERVAVETGAQHRFQCGRAAVPILARCVAPKSTCGVPEHALEVLFIGLGWQRADSGVEKSGRRNP